MRAGIQIIFQDPYASLNPRMTVGDIVGEAYEIHRGVVPRKEQRRKVRSLLDRVGLNPDYENRYPHQFSGGQRQRIGVARALALNPDIIICDEPVSALDVSVQAQVINLLEELQEEFELSYIFIAHDLSVVRHIADRVAVMYLGRIVEIGNDQQIYEKPLHPYTQALLSAVPLPDPRTREARERIVLEGDVPSPAKPPSGCHFRTRCWKAEQVCVDEVPDLVDRFDHGHPSRCHFAAPREHVLVAVGAGEEAELETIHAPMSYAPSLVGREDKISAEEDAAAAERQRALRMVSTALSLYVVFGAIGFFLLPRTFSGSVLTTVRILLVVHVLACVFLAVRASAGWVAAANLGQDRGRGRGAGLPRVGRQRDIPGGQHVHRARGGGVRLPPGPRRHQALRRIEDEDARRRTLSSAASASVRGGALAGQQVLRVGERLAARHRPGERALATVEAHVGAVQPAGQQRRPRCRRRPRARATGPRGGSSRARRRRRGPRRGRTTAVPARQPSAMTTSSRVRPPSRGVEAATTPASRSASRRRARRTASAIAARRSRASAASSKRPVSASAAMRRRRTVTTGVTSPVSTAAAAPATAA